MKKYRILTMACLTWVVATGFLGCEIKKADYEKQKDIIRKTEELNGGYLHGDIKSARDSLLQQVQLLEGATALEPRGHAQLLCLAYLHLYVLEQRATNTPSAEVALIKAHYWSLRQSELLGLGPAEALEEIKQADSAHIVAMIDKLDMKNNDNKLPKYLQDVQNLTRQP